MDVVSVARIVQNMANPETDKAVITDLKLQVVTQHPGQQGVTEMLGHQVVTE
jgi:hypothetical protein